MHDHSPTAAELLDHVVTRLEAKFQPRNPIRTYTVGPDGECNLDLPEVRERLDQLIDELPKNYLAE